MGDGLLRILHLLVHDIGDTAVHVDYRKLAEAGDFGL